MSQRWLTDSYLDGFKDADSAAKLLSAPQNGGLPIKPKLLP